MRAAHCSSRSLPGPHLVSARRAVPPARKTTSRAGFPGWSLCRPFGEGVAGGSGGPPRAPACVLSRRLPGPSPVPHGPLPTHCHLPSLVVAWCLSGLGAFSSPLIALLQITRVRPWGPKGSFKKPTPTPQTTLTSTDFSVGCPSSSQTWPRAPGVWDGSAANSRSAAAVPPRSAMCCGRAGVAQPGPLSEEWNRVWFSLPEGSFVPGPRERD